MQTGHVLNMTVVGSGFIRFIILNFLNMSDDVHIKTVKWEKSSCSELVAQKGDRGHIWAGREIQLTLGLSAWGLSQDGPFMTT